MWPATASDARNTTALATSRGRPILRSGSDRATFSSCSAREHRVLVAPHARLADLVVVFRDRHPGTHHVAPDPRPAVLPRDRLHEAVDRRFHTAVDGFTGLTLAARIGRDRHDRATLLRDHVGERGLGAVEQADVVEADDLVPELRRRLGEEHQLVPADAVHQHVDRAVACVGGAEHRLGRRQVGDVGVHELGVSGAGAACQLDHASRLTLVDVGERQRRRLRRERQCDCSADVGAGAGDHDRPALQLEIHA